jgi:ADP-ribosylglycohydrolase
MLCAIAGDVIGSAYEASAVKTTDFALFTPGSRFTDDAVLTIATAEALPGAGDYAGAYRRYGRAYPNALRRRLRPLAAQRGSRTLQ